MPSLLNRSGAASRGAAADWALKAMHVFGISPVDKDCPGIRPVDRRRARRKLNTESVPPQTGWLFRRTASPRSCLADPQTYLVFIHGTASSTQGSFHGFWDDPVKKQPTDEWKALLKTYGNRILASGASDVERQPRAEHTGSGPPASAEGHDSRDYAFARRAGWGTAWSEIADRGRPERASPGARISGSLPIWWEKFPQEFNVAKFVRTACPAGGTILASKRIDLYLNT